MPKWPFLKQSRTVASESPNRSIPDRVIASGSFAKQELQWRENNLSKNENRILEELWKQNPMGFSKGDRYIVKRPGTYSALVGYKTVDNNLAYKLIDQGIKTIVEPLDLHFLYMSALKRFVKIAYSEDFIVLLVR